MAINILKNDHFHSILGEYKGPSLDEIKKKQLDKIVKMEPILARSGLDHLIEFIPESDPPKLRWNPRVLQQLDIGQLVSVYNVLDNRLELQTRKY